MANNKVKQRVLKVLDRMSEMTKRDQGYADLFAEELEKLLDDLRDDDTFGTEAQDDPRGDGRNGEWSMLRVEGVDA